MADILTQIDDRIEELTASLNPDHSEDGISVSLGAYLDVLLRAKKELLLMRSMEDPFRIVTFTER